MPNTHHLTPAEKVTLMHETQSRLRAVLLAEMEQQHAAGVCPSCVTRTFAAALAIELVWNAVFAATVAGELQTVVGEFLSVIERQFAQQLEKGVGLPDQAAPCRESVH